MTHGLSHAETHASYHVGQVVYFSRLVPRAGRECVTMPRGDSQKRQAQGGRYLKAVKP
jgi:hypothetical protein